jgi:uncharacterized protein YkwD
VRARFVLLFLLAVGAAGFVYIPGAETVAEETRDGAVDFVMNVTTDPTLDSERLEDEIYQEINEERQARGLDPLDRRDGLDHAARGHSRDLLRTGGIGHTGSDGSDPTDRVRREGVQCRAGENVASNYFDSPVQAPTGETETYRTEAELAESTVEGWMNSRGHRENILLERWDTTGVGVAASAEKGEARVIVTQVFC